MGGGGSGIHFSSKIYPIIHLTKILGYSLKVKKKMAKNLIIHYSIIFSSIQKKLRLFINF